MAKKKKEEQVAVSEQVASSMDIVKAISYRVDRYQAEGEFGIKVNKMKHRIFQFTIDKTSDTILSSQLLVETNDPMEAMSVYQTAAGKIILEERQKEHV